MRTLFRIAAVLSFGFCFAGGSCLLVIAQPGVYSDALPIMAVGLFLVGVAFFAGSMIWLAAERCCPRPDSQLNKPSGGASS